MDNTNRSSSGWGRRHHRSPPPMHRSGGHGSSGGHGRDYHDGGDNDGSTYNSSHHSHSTTPSPRGGGGGGHDYYEDSQRHPHYHQQRGHDREEWGRDIRERGHQHQSYGDMGRPQQQQQQRVSSERRNTNNYPRVDQFGHVVLRHSPLPPRGKGGAVGGSGGSGGGSSSSTRNEYSPSSPPQQPHRGVGAGEEELLLSSPQHSLGSNNCRDIRGGGVNAAGAAEAVSKRFIPLASSRSDGGKQPPSGSDASSKPAGGKPSGNDDARGSAPPTQTASHPIIVADPPPRTAEAAASAITAPRPAATASTAAATTARPAPPVSAMRGKKSSVEDGGGGKDGKDGNESGSTSKESSSKKKKSVQFNAKNDSTKVVDRYIHPDDNLQQPQQQQQQQQSVNMAAFAHGECHPRAAFNASTNNTSASSNPPHPNNNPNNHPSNSNNNPNPKKARNMCRLQGHTHPWYHCPNNPYGDNFGGIDHRTMKLSSDPGEAMRANASAQLALDKSRGIVVSKEPKKDSSGKEVGRTRNGNDPGKLTPQENAAAQKAATFEKRCKKRCHTPGHSHPWYYCPLNKYGGNYQAGKFSSNPNDWDDAAIAAMNASAKAAMAKALGDINAATGGKNVIGKGTGSEKGGEKSGNSAVSSMRGSVIHTPATAAAAAAGGTKASSSTAAASMPCIPKKPSPRAAATALLAGGGSRASAASTTSKPTASAALLSNTRVTKPLSLASKRASTAAAASRDSSSSSSMFNTTNSARPIPRKSTGLQKRNSTGSSSLAPIPKKRKFQRSNSQENAVSLSAGGSLGGVSRLHTQQQVQAKSNQQQAKSNQQQQQQWNVPTQNKSQQAPHHHQQAAAAATEKVQMTNKKGQWRRNVIRAPSGSDAIPLQKYRSTRLGGKKGKGVFSPQRGEEEEKEGMEGKKEGKKEEEKEIVVAEAGQGEVAVSPEKRGGDAESGLLDTDDGNDDDMGISDEEDRPHVKTVSKEKTKEPEGEVIDLLDSDDDDDDDLPMVTLAKKTKQQNVASVDKEKPSSDDESSSSSSDDDDDLPMKAMAKKKSASSNGAKKKKASQHDSSSSSDEDDDDLPMGALMRKKQQKQRKEQLDDDDDSSDDDDDDDDDDLPMGEAIRRKQFRRQQSLDSNDSNDKMKKKQQALNGNDDTSSDDDDHLLMGAIARRKKGGKEDTTGAGNKKQSIRASAKEDDGTRKVSNDSDSSSHEDDADDIQMGETIPNKESEVDGSDSSDSDDDRSMGEVTNEEFRKGRQEGQGNSVVGQNLQRVQQHLDQQRQQQQKQNVSESNGGGGRSGNNDESHARGKGGAGTGGDDSSAREGKENGSANGEGDNDQTSRSDGDDSGEANNGNEQTNSAELDEAIVAEFEKDLFAMIDQTISLNAEWRRKIEKQVQLLQNDDSDDDVEAPDETAMETSASIPASDHQEVGQLDEEGPAVGRINSANDDNFTAGKEQVRRLQNDDSDDDEAPDETAMETSASIPAPDNQSDEEAPAVGHVGSANDDKLTEGQDNSCVGNTIETPGVRSSPAPHQGIHFQDMWEIMKLDGWARKKGWGLVDWVFLHPTLAAKQKNEICRVGKEGETYFTSEDALKQYAMRELGWKSDDYPVDDSEILDSSMNIEMADRVKMNKRAASSATSAKTLCPENGSLPNRHSHSTAEDVSSANDNAPSSADASHPENDVLPDFELHQESTPVTDDTRSTRAQSTAEQSSPVEDCAPSETGENLPSKENVPTENALHPESEALPGNRSNPPSSTQDDLPSPNFDVPMKKTAACASNVDDANMTSMPESMDDSGATAGEVLPTRATPTKSDKQAANERGAPSTPTLEMDESASSTNNDGSYHSDQEHVSGQMNPNFRHSASQDEQKNFEEELKKLRHDLEKEADEEVRNELRAGIYVLEKRIKEAKEKMKDLMEASSKATRESSICGTTEEETSEEVTPTNSAPNQVAPHKPTVDSGEPHLQQLEDGKKKKKKDKKQKDKVEKKKKKRGKKRALADKEKNGIMKKQKGNNGSGCQGANSDGPWTEEEKRLYLEGISKHQRNWGEISREFVTSRTAHQIREYARSSLSSNNHHHPVQSAQGHEQESPPPMSSESDVSVLNQNNGQEEPSTDSPRASNSISLSHEKENVPPVNGQEEQQSEDDSDTNSESSGSDDDGCIVFVTCDKCSMVFTKHDEACRHEETCPFAGVDNASIIGRGGKVFDNKTSLIQYMIDGGKPVTEEDMVFYRQNSSNGRRPASLGNTRDQRRDSGNSRRQRSDDFTERDAAQSTPADAGRDVTGKNRTRENSCCSYEADEATEMNLVKNLCYTTVDEVTGLPTQHITVMCGDSETLYDFRVDIRESNIPNAGHGAFLTYLGARVLKKRPLERSARLMTEHVIANDICTHDSLLAETLGGRRMNVSLTGKNLHYNDNSIYWTNKRLRKFAESSKKDIQLKSKGLLAGDTNTRRQSSMESFDESEVDCAIHEEVEQLRNCIPEEERIGFLGINRESDYRHDDNKEFWSYPNGMFQLGRYGPHRHEDRKTQLEFDFKNFIHDYEPSEWSYDVPELKQNRRQIVDITDDTTGKVHPLAKRHTPIYVNEIGHNPALNRNVHIRDKHDRSVYYYVGIDREHAMKKYQTVELFVDYGDHYEQVRERKGYGRINMDGHLGSDEEEGAKLIRNFHEREEAEEDISTLEIYPMFHLVEFLEKISDPIDKLINSSFLSNGCTRSGGNSNHVKWRDLIARRRLHWISEKLFVRLQEIKANPSPISIYDCVTSIEKSLQRMNLASSMSVIFNQLNPELRKVLLGELTEELLYQARSDLPSPLNRAVWSNLAVDLTRKCSISLAQYLFCYSGPMAVRMQYLGDALLKHAKRSANALREGSVVLNGIRSESVSEDDVDHHISQLSFKSPTREINAKHLLDKGNEKMMSIYEAPNTIRFGTAAAMADIQAYYDAVELCGMDSYFVPGETGQMSEYSCSIVSDYVSDGIHDSDKRRPQFFWMARSDDAIKRGHARVNEQWYLENQIFLVVHVLASTCADWGQCSGEEGNEWYSLRKLCAAMGLDEERGKQTMSQGAVKPKWPEPEIAPIYSPSRSDAGRRRREQGRRKNGTGKQPVPDPEFPGWFVHGEKRKTGDHIDKFWSHPGLGEGVLLRSKTGVKALIDYMNANGVEIRAAYIANRNHTKYFRLRV